MESLQTLILSNMKDYKKIEPIYEEEDKLDGGKAVGCLFIGVAIIIIVCGIGSYLISLIR